MGDDFTMSSRLLFSIALAGILYVQPAISRGDVAPPGDCSGLAETAPCSDKKAGDSCTFSNGTAGNCAATRCATDAGTAVLQCVATGANSMGGCSAFSGTGSGAQNGLFVVCAAFVFGSLALMMRRQKRA